MKKALSVILSILVLVNTALAYTSTVQVKGIGISVTSDENVDVANKATNTYSFRCDIPISPDAIFRRQRTE